MKLQEQTEFTPLTVQDVIPMLRNVKKSGSGWTALCPSHDDNRNSLSVNDGGDKVLIKCHAGCEYETIIQDLGLWREEQDEKKFHVVKEYDYVDEHGELIFQVVRLKPKGFAQRRLDENGEWVYSIKGVIRVLYNLPELIASQQVFVVEGEKDADRLNELGFVATTNSGGAGKWVKEYNKYFKDKDVIVIPDNDPVGLAHGEEVAKNVFPTARSVKVLYLEGLHEKQDLYDWLRINEVEDLNKLIEETPVTTFEEDELNFDNELPNSVESEMAILGAILKNGKLITKAIESKILKDFHSPKNKKILQAMLDCFDQKQKIDYVTVSEVLKQKHTLNSIGGIEHLKELIANAPDAINIDSWVKIVAGKADLRAFLDISKKVNKVALNELDSAENLRIELGQDLHNIRRQERTKSFHKLFDTVEVVADQIKNTPEGLAGISTGFVDIDGITSGLQKSDLFILAGRPSMGKTALAMNIAYKVARQGHKVLIFSLEMSKEQLGKRMIASESRVGLTALNTSNMDKYAWGRVADVMPEIEDAMFYVDDTPGLSVAEMRSKLQEFEEEFGKADLVVIDYLQLMAGGTKIENRQQEVSRISRELKGMAREFKLPVLALSQLSRAPEARSDSRPRMSDLRESGAIEQDADVVAFVYREEYYNKTPENEGMAEVIFSKQRNGASGTIDLMYFGKFTRFENMFEV